MSDINLIGLASSDFVPGNYLQINFSSGPASLGATTYSAILIGNMLSTGSAQKDGYVYGPDTQVVLSSETDAINLFGSGSELHRMWRAFNRVNKSTNLYAIAVSEGVGAAASTGTITVVGTATQPCTVRCIIGDTVCDTGVAPQDTATVIIANMVASINSHPELHVTASVGSGVVTLTSKQKGLRSNQIRYSVQQLPNVTTSGVTVGPLQRTNMSGGTSSDSNTLALSTILGSRYYYQVSAANNEDTGTQFTALVNQTNANAAPVVGLRCRAITALTDSSVSTAITFATGLNAARAEVVWMANSDWTSAELAANAAGVYANFEAALGSEHSLNFDNFGTDAVTQQYWYVPAQLDGTNPSRNTIKSALQNGLTPIVPLKGSSSKLVKRVTTKSITSGSPDYRIRDAHKVTICDQFGDDLINAANTQLGGKALVNDPVKGQRAPGRAVVYPAIFRSIINRLLLDYDSRNLLQNVNDIIANVEVVRETSPTTRISARIPLQTIDILDQTATLIDQIA